MIDAFSTFWLTRVEMWSHFRSERTIPSVVQRLQKVLGELVGTLLFLFLESHISSLIVNVCSYLSIVDRIVYGWPVRVNEQELP